MDPCVGWGNNLREPRWLTKSLSLTTKENFVCVLCDYSVRIIEWRYYYVPLQKTVTVTRVRVYPISINARHASKGHCRTKNVVKPLQA